MRHACVHGVHVIALSLWIWVVFRSFMRANGWINSQFTVCKISLDPPTYPPFLLILLWFWKKITHIPYFTQSKFSLTEASPNIRVIITIVINQMMVENTCVEFNICFIDPWKTQVRKIRVSQRENVVIEAKLCRTGVIIINPIYF